MEMTQKKPSKWRKVAISAAVGAVTGAGGMILLIPLFESGPLSSTGASEQVAGSVGMIYALIALFIGAGLASPGIGTRFLNVEDADELRDQRRMLASAAAAMALMAGGLIVLALAGDGGIVSRPAALAVAAVVFAATIPLTVNQWRHMDELMRNVATETGNVAYYLILLVGGGWAILAHLDFAPPPAPLDWLTMLFGLALVASFVASGRRGMLVPR